ncbi:2-oxoacid:acceptor oxidoreductase subunit alpha [Thiosulfativibrio zosterae]|uniref:2-oxoglutarate synthase n=1 Tax=Thiosulfativibrio zosterae TaxID=2675053 RepID=A0A6F8PKZ4_9GAMM|nr:2-oxoacid:acceptor oxidoreductase subunit alpha [Thiosulfativibrio zosterae]BBP42756.1 2-oxoglutarate synthase [Thiosulfativibrio zosterae]
MSNKVNSHAVLSNRLAVSISGSGGSGALTTGQILLNAFGLAGFYGVMNRSSGPQIRGGESAVMLSLSDQPLELLPDVFQVHFALDWRNFERFADEIPLNQNSWVFFDNSREKPPGLVEKSGAKVLGLNLSATLKDLPDGRANMLALGILAAWVGLDIAVCEQALRKTLGKKGDAVLSSSLAALQAGQALLLAKLPSQNVLANWQAQPASKWLMSGNEAVGLGALQGGVRFAAAYPITPATEIVEYLAPRIEKLGGHLLIAEDELAAINMVIGASFGGVPAMTSTSGPGFSLMTEAMGLAIASETPVLVVNVMRGGPSTGIPTKSEQTDLNQILYGFHGEAPHVVLAPISIADCAPCAFWATGLAEALQTLVVLISDQRIGQSKAILEPLTFSDQPLKRQTLAQGELSDYQRYALTESSISPMSEPGLMEGIYTADGLEHNPSGLPSSQALDHQQQLHKRAAKLNQFDYGEHWAWSKAYAVPNSARQICLVTWGSSTAVCQEAALQMQTARVSVQVLALRLLMPLQVAEIQTICKNQEVWVVEQSASGQFIHYLWSQQAIPATAQSIAQAGPLMISVRQILDAILGENHE